MNERYFFMGFDLLTQEEEFSHLLKVVRYLKGWFFLSFWENIKH